MARIVTSMKTKKLRPVNTIPTHRNPSSRQKNMMSPIVMFMVVCRMSTISSLKKAV